MFSFYPDFYLKNEDDVCEISEIPGSKSTIKHGRPSSPQSKWSTSPKNPVWGDVIKSPSHSNRSKQVETSGCLSNRRSDTRDSGVSPAPRETPESPTHSRGTCIPNHEQADWSNLSPTMRRALRVLRIHNSSTLPPHQSVGDGEFEKGSLLSFNVAMSTLAEKEKDDRDMHDFELREHSQGLETGQNIRDASSKSCDSPTEISRSMLTEELRNSILESLSNSRCHPTIPTNLDGEFVAMKDTLDPSGGVRVSRSF